VQCRWALVGNAAASDQRGQERAKTFPAQQDDGILDSKIRVLKLFAGGSGDSITEIAIGAHRARKVGKIDCASIVNQFPE
jgi:hypothetical protein